MNQSVGTLGTLGAAVKQARVERGLTQNELAQKAHVSRPFVSNLERGQGPRAELSRVLAVIRALDLDLQLAPPKTPQRSFADALDELLK